MSEILRPSDLGAGHGIDRLRVRVYIQAAAVFLLTPSPLLSPTIVDSMSSPSDVMKHRDPVCHLGARALMYQRTEYENDKETLRATRAGYDQDTGH